MEYLQNFEVHKCWISYQEQNAGDRLRSSRRRRVPLHRKRQVREHHAHNYRHRRGAYQEHISVFELLRRREFEYKAVVYPRLAPHEYVASVEEQVQKQEAEHAASIKYTAVQVT